MSQVAVSPDLLAKYGTHGPRYTSYPTAPHFSEEVDRRRIAEEWRRADADLSLYLHVPFCQVRCTFCGCHVQITRRRERSGEHVDRLLAELDLAGELVDLRRPLRQLHLGGGTPNFLLPGEMERLVRGLETRTAPAADAERAIECDPRTLERDYAQLLLDLGFNRFSFGVQDLDTDVMSAVNRAQSLGDVEAVVAAVRSRGPVPVNFDLIYGLPRQTPSSWRKTLERALAMRPSRLAVYGYAHVPWLKRHQVALERHGLPTPRERADLEALARDVLLSAGYLEIGLDHYALPDDELAVARRDGTLHRNFMGYTTRRGLDMVAVGPSGISRVGRSFVQDHKDVATWGSKILAGSLPWERGLLLDEDDVVRGEVITELSCNGLARFSDFRERHGIDFVRTFSRELDALRALEADGLLTVGEEEIRLTPIGRYLVRNACMVFDAWLDRDAGGGPRYSSTT